MRSQILYRPNLTNPRHIEFHAVDFDFHYSGSWMADQFLDSRYWIPITSGITNSGFHGHDFPDRFRNQDLLTWGNLYLIFTSHVMI